MLPADRAQAPKHVVPGTFSGGKGGRCVRLTNSSPSCAECYEIWEPKPPGTLWATPGLLPDFFRYSALVGIKEVTAVIQNAGLSNLSEYVLASRGYNYLLGHSFTHSVIHS